MPLTTNAASALPATTEVPPSRQGVALRTGRPGLRRSTSTTSTLSVARRSRRRSPVRLVHEARDARSTSRMPDVCLPDGKPLSGEHLDSLLDEEFDDFNCDLAMLIRLANAP